MLEKHSSQENERQRKTEHNIQDFWKTIGKIGVGNERRNITARTFGKRSAK